MANVRYTVYRKKWYNLFWHRCRGLQPLFDIYETVEEAKAAIPLYDQGACYWTGTMVDLTRERIASG